MTGSATIPAAALALEIEGHRVALTVHCRRMLGSPFDAEDAVQDTMVRAWRGIGRFEGRAALRTWLYRIATNVCVDMLDGQARRASPIGLAPADAPDASATERAAQLADPAEVAAARESLRLALALALRHLPPRQRGVLILCEGLRWRAAEAAELLGTSVASVTSALQRARAALASAGPPEPLGAADRALLARYLEAFERDDVAALASLIREDAGRP